MVVGNNNVGAQDEPVDRPQGKSGVGLKEPFIETELPLKKELLEAPKLAIRPKLSYKDDIGGVSWFDRPSLYNYGDGRFGNMLLIEYPRHKCMVLNENTNIIIVGMPGRGKTWAAIKIAERLDPNFNVDRVANTYEEFFNIINSNRDNLPKGSVIIFDEFQKDANSRKWQSAINQALNDVIHTFRNLNLICIFTTPKFSFIDKNMRSAVHMIIEVKRKLEHESKVECSVWQCEMKNDPNNPDEAFRWRPRMNISDGYGKAIITSVLIRAPSVALRNAIDEKVNRFKNNVRLEAMDGINKRNAPKTSKKTGHNVLERAQEIAKVYVDGDKSRYTTVVRGRVRFDQYKVMADYKISEGSAKSACRLAEHYAGIQKD